MSLVGYVDLTQLSKDLTDLSGGSLRRNTQILVASTLAQVETLASSYAPRRTGKMAGTIRTETFNSGLGGSVRVSMNYAKYVEFGTGTRGEFPGQPIIIRPKTGKYLKFTTKDGRTIYTKQVTNPGMAPRPFLRPAFERVVVPLVAGIADTAALSIVKGPNAPETLRNAPATGWH